MTAAQAAASSVTEEDAVSVQVAAAATVSVTTEPAAQVPQALASSAAENFPSPQAVQAKSEVVVPAVGSKPAPQVVVDEWATQAVDEAESSSYLPEAHPVHVVLAVPSTAAA